MPRLAEQLWASLILLKTWLGEQIGELAMKTDETHSVPAEQSTKFRWLICQSSDDEGDVVYGCKAENSAKFFEDSPRKLLATAHERNYLIVGNRVTINVNDYCVLQPRPFSGLNRNQTEAAFDTRGIVKAKPLPAPMEDDLPTGFVTDLTQALVNAFFNTSEPHVAKTALHKDATNIVYDLVRFRCTQQAHFNNPTQWQSARAVPHARELYSNSLLPPQSLKIQLSFSYTNAYGHNIQKKVQAERSPLDINNSQAVTYIHARSTTAGLSSTTRASRSSEPWSNLHDTPPLAHDQHTCSTYLTAGNRRNSLGV